MSQLHQEISQLKEELSIMARKCQAIFTKATEAMTTKNQTLVEEVLLLDKEIDGLEISLDTSCMRLLILKEPHAVDFRYVFSAIKSIRDLERIGDESKTIAKWVSKLNGAEMADLKNLAVKAREALDAATEALINGDTAKAQKTLEIEFAVDDIEDRIMQSSPTVPMAFIAKAMERVGDLATNIAENVIFSVKAEEIRHGQHIKI